MTKPIEVTLSSTTGLEVGNRFTMAGNSAVFRVLDILPGGVVYFAPDAPAGVNPWPSRILAALASAAALGWLAWLIAGAN